MARTKQTRRAVSDKVRQKLGLPRKRPPAPKNAHDALERIKVQLHLSAPLLHKVGGIELGGIELRLQLEDLFQSIRECVPPLEKEVAESVSDWESELDTPECIDNINPETSTPPASPSAQHPD